MTSPVSSITPRAALRAWETVTREAAAAMEAALADPALSRSLRLRAVQSALLDVAGAGARLTEVVARDPYPPERPQRGGAA